MARTGLAASREAIMKKVYVVIDHDAEGHFDDPIVAGVYLSKREAEDAILSFAVRRGGAVFFSIQECAVSGEES
jgi:hypothetical protein